VVVLHLPQRLPRLLRLLRADLGKGSTASRMKRHSATKQLRCFGLAGLLLLRLFQSREVDRIIVVVHFH
jgi:hypothetical protein